LLINVLEIIFRYFKKVAYIRLKLLSFQDSFMILFNLFYV